MQITKLKKKEKQSQNFMFHWKILIFFFKYFLRQFIKNIIFRQFSNVNCIEIFLTSLYDANIDTCFKHTSDLKIACGCIWVLLLVTIYLRCYRPVVRNELNVV